MALRCSVAPDAVRHIRRRTGAPPPGSLSPRACAGGSLVALRPSTQASAHVLPRSPLLPDWVPDGVLVFMTLVVEAVIVFAIHELIVVRAENRTRANAVFWIAVAAVALGHGACGHCLFAADEPWRQACDLYLAACICAAVTVVLTFSWFEVHARSPRGAWALALTGVAAAVLTLDRMAGPGEVRHRRFLAHLTRTDHDYHTEAVFYFSWEETGVLHRPRGRLIQLAVEAPAVGWESRLPLRCRVEDAGMVEIRLPDGKRLDTDTVLDDLWAFRDAPVCAETARALWETLVGSTFALDHGELWPLVSLGF